MKTVYDSPTAVSSVFKRDQLGVKWKMNYKEVLLSVEALTAVMLFFVFICALLLFVSPLVFPFLLVKTRN